MSFNLKINNKSSLQHPRRSERLAKKEENPKVGTTATKGINKARNTSSTQPRNVRGRVTTQKTSSQKKGKNWVPPPLSYSENLPLPSSHNSGRSSSPEMLKRKAEFELERAAKRSKVEAPVVREAEVFNSAGDAYCAAKQYDKAIEAYSSDLENSDNSAKEKIELCRTLQIIQNAEKEEDPLEKAKGLKKFAGLFILNKLFENAVDVCVEGLKLQKEHNGSSEVTVGLLILQGMAHAELKQFDQALELFNRAESIEHNNTLLKQDLYYSWGKAHNDQGQQESALQVWGKWRSYCT